MGFAGAGRPDEDQVGALVDELQIEPLIDLSFGEGGLRAEVKLFNGLVHGETRLSPMQVNALGHAAAAFKLGQLLGEL